MQAQRLPARQGVVWVIAGYRLFRANMPLLSLLTFGYLMIFTLLSLLPKNIGVIIFLLIQPMLILAIANACQSMDSKSRLLAAPDLLTGILSHKAELIRLGSLQVAASLLTVFFVGLVFLFLGLDIKADAVPSDQVWPVLVFVVLFALPLQLAFWFAPLLIGWHNLPPVKSLFFSLVATLRNWRAFTAYALTLFAILFLPTLLSQLAIQVSEVFGQVVARTIEVLILILVMPVILAGTYISYRDIFVAPAALPASQLPVDE